MTTCTNCGHDRNVWHKRNREGVPVYDGFGNMYDDIDPKAIVCVFYRCPCRSFSEPARALTGGNVRRIDTDYREMLRTVRVK